MISNTFNETFSQEWINKNMPDPTNELVLFRQIIPWEKLVKHLSKFYIKAISHQSISPSAISHQMTISMNH